MVSEETGLIRGSASMSVIGFLERGADRRSRVCAGVWTKAEAAHIQVQINEACRFACAACSS